MGTSRHGGPQAVAMVPGRKCSPFPAARGGCRERGSMETHELFRRLGAGARFDVRRFGLDARRFGVRGHRGEGSGTGP